MKKEYAVTRNGFHNGMSDTSVDWFDTIEEAKNVARIRAEFEETWMCITEFIDGCQNTDLEEDEVGWIGCGYGANCKLKEMKNYMFLTKNNIEGRKPLYSNGPHVSIESKREFYSNLRKFYSDLDNLEVLRIWEVEEILGVDWTVAAQKKDLTSNKKYAVSVNGKYDNSLTEWFDTVIEAENAAKLKSEVEKTTVFVAEFIDGCRNTEFKELEIMRTGYNHDANGKYKDMKNYICHIKNKNTGEHQTYTDCFHSSVDALKEFYSNLGFEIWKAWEAKEIEIDRNEWDNIIDWDKMNTFTGYVNHGCLSEKKIPVYTAGNPAPSAVTSDAVVYAVPDGWVLDKTESGDYSLAAPWGEIYRPNDLLCGKESPCFAGRDKKGNGFRITLDYKLI